MEELRCQICDVLICETNISQDTSGSSFLSGPKRLEIGSERGNLSIRCPFCSAKNIAEERTAPSGTRILEVVRGVME